MTMDPSGITAPWVTKAPAAMMQSRPTTAPLRTMAPMPTRVLSPMVQPWRMAAWPTVQSRPTLVGKPGSAWRTQLSWILLPGPTVMGSVSARSTAPK